MHIRCFDVTVGGRRSMFMIFISSPAIGWPVPATGRSIQFWPLGRRTAAGGDLVLARLYVINCHRADTARPRAVSGEDTVSDRRDRCGS